MKKAQITDLLREMKKSFNRYISILAIMALGVAFYAGVRSSEPDMQLSVKKYFDETEYMDIRVKTEWIDTQKFGIMLVGCENIYSG